MSKPGKPKRAKLSPKSHQSQAEARFLIIQEDESVPVKKGPFYSDKTLAACLREARASYGSPAIFTVAEIAHGPDLWVSDAEEWLNLYDFHNTESRGT